MFGILITALGEEERIDLVINKLISKGYSQQDISLITKIKNYESNSKDNLADNSEKLSGLLSKAQIFPNLGEILVTGPVAPAINFISSPETDPQNSLFTLFLSIGIPKEDAFYFIEVIERDGFILILPEFGDLSIYEILWNNGADRIIVLEEDPGAQFGTL